MEMHKVPAPTKHARGSGQGWAGRGGAEARDRLGVAELTVLLERNR